MERIEAYGYYGWLER
ncbi:unnamed protein product [Spirodela intermedia]|uniref:Uncharacterized protein n=1 Tax=Spirodela intermedia TaxID=51605 RepID=A0A7I8KBT5_SPIIN|nr:unnamed protein product [Spirodela intermedia]